MIVITAYQDAIEPPRGITPWRNNIDFSNLNLGSVSLAALAIGLIAGLWSKIKLLAWRIINLVVVRMVLEYRAAPAVASYLWKHGKRSRYGERSYSGDDLFVRAHDRRLVVSYEEVGHDPFVFWVGWRPIIAQLSAVTAGSTSTGFRLTLTFLRWTFDPDTLVKLAVDEWNAKRHGDGQMRFSIRRCVGNRNKGDVFSRMSNLGPPGTKSNPMASEEGGMSNSGRRYIGYTDDEIGQNVPKAPLAHLAFPPAIADLAGEVERWRNSESWYKDRSIPWRMGIGFTGAPGCGKTSYAKGLAQAIDFPVLVFEIATFADRDMIEFWHEAQSLAPCVVLIEDIDTVFNGRENIIEGDDRLSFGCVLNCLSGVEGADGILTIVTTNHPETLDPALGIPNESGMSSRPGRIDRIVELGPPDESCRIRIAERILDEYPDEISPAVIAGCGDSGAQFTKRCGDIALRRWRDRGRPAS